MQDPVVKIGETHLRPQNLRDLRSAELLLRKDPRLTQQVPLYLPLESTLL